ncbi:MAG: type II secretion system F family protein [Pseudomonadota bacterium]
MNLTFAPLPYRIRADLFAHLGAMEHAGLAPQQAFALLRLPGQSQPRLVKARALLARGDNPALAGLKSGLFTVFEASLLRAALCAGSPAPTYKRLSAHYARKAQQLGLIKARMTLPVATLVLALFVQPLPQLFSGALSLSGAVWHALRPLLLLSLLALLCVHGSAWFLSGGAGAARSSVERIVLALPLFGPMHIRRNARDFFESLALLLEAGVPMFEALPTATDTVNNSVLRAQFARILPALRGGAPLAQALDCLTLSDPQRLLAFVQAGESSGTLPEMILRHVDMETEAIDLFQRQLADWLPRILYACVAAWMASSLLGAGRIGAPVPVDL